MKPIKDKLIEILRDFPSDIDIRLMIRGVKTDYQKNLASRIIKIFKDYENTKKL